MIRKSPELAAVTMRWIEAMQRRDYATAANLFPDPRTAATSGWTPMSASALQVRIGLHLGDVVVTDDDYLGTTVNMAARIAAAAGGGETVVSGSVRAVLSGEPEVSFGEPRTVRLKGIEGLHEVSDMRRAEAG